MKREAFEPVNTRIRFPDIEQEMLAIWDKEDTFRASLEATKEAKAYVFYDGPPFATGLPHYGHLLAGTIKDIIPRYWTMHNRSVERRFGWDCHGLPVENEMEKELKVTGKRDIEQMGIHLFNEACRSIVLRYTGQWEKVVKRMGRWVDFENQYRTMDPPYMESIWWVFKQIWKKELMYHGFRVQPYCPRCATPLSNFEVNEGYKDTTGPSITVSFPLLDDKQTHFLVWTTTPWTLPSNVALAVGPTIVYAKIRDGANQYILAKDRLSTYYKTADQYEIIAEMPGHELAGMRYQPLFDFFAHRDERFFQVTTAAYVSTEDGTGIVHIAPAFGEDDFQVGSKLGLPIICPVDDEGRFTDEVSPWQGRIVYEADEDIIRTIKTMGRLIQRSSITHRYPFCYRCDSALIYKAITTWFMKIEPLKKNMLENNEQIHWVPSHLQTGRFGKGIASAPDWNISRNRYWGTPLPIWICSCGHHACVGSLAELHQLVGNGDEKLGAALHAKAAKSVEEQLHRDARPQLEKWATDPSWADRLESVTIDPNDLHRHIVDTLTLQCPVCKKATMQRTPEVLDCWFESGSMPYAQMHYPFENQKRFEANFPADFIAEGLDQTRGWFYTLTVLGAALFGKPAFKNVIVNGIILSEEGKKLSKRLKNYAPPENILNQLGADALRLFLINSPAVKAEDLRFSENGVREMSRSILLPLWNAYSFFVTYTNIDGWHPTTIDPPQDGTELDQWIISLLNHTITSVNEEMAAYNLYKVVPLLVDYIDNLTNWYIRRSRRRFWKSENDNDKAVAYHTLYSVLVTFSRVMAPFLPFLTDAIYRNLVLGKIADAPASIHLMPYPAAHKELAREDLERKMLLVRKAVTMGRALRSRFVIKTRQPLQSVTLIVSDEATCKLLTEMAPLIQEELNVKEVKLDTKEDAVVSISAKANFKRLGKLFGQAMKNAAAQIELFTVKQIVELQKGDSITILEREIGFDDIEIRRTKHEGIEVETEGELTVALDTTLTETLLQEGVAREFINRVQTIRKASDFQVSDRINIHLLNEPMLKKALDQFTDYVCSETLATTITWQTERTDGMETIDIDDTVITISVQRV